MWQGTLHEREEKGNTGKRAVRLMSKRDRVVLTADFASLWIALAHRTV